MLLRSKQWHGEMYDIGILHDYLLHSHYNTKASCKNVKVAKREKLPLSSKMLQVLQHTPYEVSSINYHELLPVAS